jgi:hypothetical protein
MSPIQVKLVQSDPIPIIRRVTFGEQPSWTQLALRIETLFNIPVQDVGVSYVDRYVSLFSFGVQHSFIKPFLSLTEMGMFFIQIFSYYY